MRDGPITQPDAGVAPVALTTNRNTTDRLLGDVVSLKVTHPAITEVSYPLISVARVRKISEAR